MKNKLAKGAVWLGGAKILVNMLALASNLVFARLLTPEDFGLVAIATVLLAILGAMTELSLASALIHHEAPTNSHFHAAWTLNVLRALVIGGLFAASAPLVASFYHDARLNSVVLIASLSVLIGGFYNPKMVIRTRNLEFWPEFAVMGTQRLAGFVVGVGLALAFRSYWALLGASLVTQAVGLLVSYLVYPYRPRFVFRHINELLSFSIWITLAQAVNTLNLKFDHLLIGAYLGPQTLGTYTVGDNFAAMPTRETTGPIQQTLFPGFRTVVGDQAQLRRTYQRAQAMISVIALPMGFGCALLAKPLVMLVLGAKWQDAILVVQVLACVFALGTMTSTYYPLALAKGETRLLFKRDMLIFCVRVPIIVVGMLLGGMPGIIYARLVAYVISCTIEMMLVHYLIGLSARQQFENNTRSLLSVLAMSVTLILATQIEPANAGWIEQAVRLSGLTALGAAVYLCFLFAFWFVADCPVGPEADFLSLLGKVRIKWSTIRSA